MDTADVFGLIGYPLGHSFSKKFFTERFAADGSGRSYLNFEIETLDKTVLDELLQLTPRLKGFNVTAPHKRAIVPFVHLNGVAADIGAVNTVKVVRKRDGISLEGYNTDVPGFRDAIAPLLHGTHTRALVLGTGGASEAAVAALRGLGIECRRVSRTGRAEAATYDEIARDGLGGATVIVNATPAGTWPDVDSCPPFSYGLIHSGCVCFDMVYNPAETLFMRRCAERGATTCNGLQMLHNQALESLRIWENE